MDNIVKGKAWTFGDNINTESIMPTGTDFDAALAAPITLKFYDPEFAENVKPGDIVVGGANFGNSSSRPAGKVFKYIGVPVLIVESAARVFFRNTWNIGVPILECPDITKLVNKGDILEVEITSGKIKNLTTGVDIQAEKPGDILIGRWKAGGMVGWVKSHKEDYPGLL